MARNSSKQFVSIDMEELSKQSQTLLANIRFASIEAPIKSVVITSSGVDEGKSTTALALAMAMAKSGKRTLLVDCDMRRRSLAVLLGVSSKPGIYSILAGQTSIKQALTPTKTHNMYFLDCEPHISNPSDMLSTKRFSALLLTLREVFDYVVIDTPPIGLFIDAAVVAKQSDGVAVVVRQRKTNKNAVSDALNQLRAADARILGLIMTFAQKDDSDYYRYRSYFSGEKPFDKKTSASSKREFDEEDIDVWARKVGVRTKYLSSPDMEVASKGRKSGTYEPKAFKGASE